MLEIDNHSEAETISNQEPSTPIRPAYMLGLVLLFFLIGYAFCGPLLPNQVPATRDTQPAAALQPPAEPDNLQLPDPSFSPSQVVAKQMDALSACRQDRRAIHQVFAFASQANKSVTGPIERFEKMVMTPPYNAMVLNDHWMPGSEIKRDGLATVLVTTVDARGGISLFRFFLSTKSETYPGCWMTDRVICLYQQGPDQEPVTDAKTPSGIGI